MLGNHTMTVAQKCVIFAVLVLTLPYVYCFHGVLPTSPVLFFYCCGLNSGSLWGLSVFCEGSAFFSSGIASFGFLHIVGLVAVDFVLFLECVISSLESVPYSQFYSETGVCVGVLRGIVAFI
jgi:hypothetical protein